MSAIANAACRRADRGLVLPAPVVLAPLVLALVLVATACASGAPPGPSNAAAAARPPGRLAWGPCAGAGWAPAARCADLPVPLDHARPDGPQLAVRVSWSPATDRAHRRGVLIANPGGPGASGLHNAAAAAQPSPIVAQALAGYDLVGFDPRGVGASSPVSCGLSPEQRMAVTAPTPAREGTEADARLAASTAQSCAERGGALLEHMSTADVAADMELLRKSLGASTVSYYGSSYGTELGVVYDALYPGHLDRVVLDSLVDSEHGWFDRTRQIAAATETRFNDFTAWAAAHAPGTSPGEVRARVLTEVAERQRVPLTLPGVAVDGSLLRRAIYGLVGRNRFDQLAALLQCAGRPAGDPCHPAMARALTALTTDTGSDAGSGEQAASAYLGVTCSDSPWPREPATYTRAAAEDAARYPVTAGGFAQISPCVSWPVPARPLITAAHRPGPPQFLLLNNTHDRISTLDGARSTLVALGPRARLVTVQGWNHQILGNHDPCADTLVADWLDAGRLPISDTTCP